MLAVADLASTRSDLSNVNVDPDSSWNLFVVSTLMSAKKGILVVAELGICFLFVELKDLF